MGIPIVFFMAFTLADGASTPSTLNLTPPQAVASTLSAQFSTAPFGASGVQTFLASAASRIPEQPMGVIDSEVEQVEEAPFQFTSEKKSQTLRERLPVVGDPSIQAILNDPSLMFYTEAEMPPAYQFWDGQLQGVHSVNYNISADGGEPFGNGNREFPWSSPAGMHRTNNTDTFRFIWLPKDEEGKRRPIVWYRRRQSNNGVMGYAWSFPIGAVVGEVLSMRGPDGKLHTFELRVRKREGKDWAVDVFRPFPTSEHLVRRIEELRPDWHENESLASFCGYLTSPRDLKELTLADRQPGKRTFSQKMGVDKLPELKDDVLVAELLDTTTFKTAMGATWRWGENGVRAVAPTTDAKFHIVPARFDAGFVDVDSVSCMRCHETVNQDIDQFDARRDWYGRIRGSDGIFTFHPFSPSSISYNGYGNGVSMRSSMVKAGVLARFNAKLHPAKSYSRIRSLVE